MLSLRASNIMRVLILKLFARVLRVFLEFSRKFSRAEKFHSITQEIPLNTLDFFGFSCFPGNEKSEKLQTLDLIFKGLPLSGIGDQIWTGSAETCG